MGLRVCSVFLSSNTEKVYPRANTKLAYNWLHTDYYRYWTVFRILFTYLQLQQLQWLSNRSCWTKNIFPQPHIKLRRCLGICIQYSKLYFLYCIPVLLCILNTFSLSAPATKVTFQQEQLPTGHQVNVSCSAKNIFPQPRIKLTWGLL